MSSHGNPGDRRSELAGLGRDAAEHAPFPLAMVEGGTCIVRYVNPAFVRLLDQPRDQLIGKELGHLLPTRIEFGPVIDRVVRTRESETVSDESASGDYAMAAFALWPVSAGDNVVGAAVQITAGAKPHAGTVAMNEALVLGAVRQHEITEAGEALNRQLHEEITERKRIEEALELAKGLLADRAGQLEVSVAERTAELSATNKELRALVYSIAHDLRAPLRAMQGFSEMLVEEAAGTLSATGVKYANRINQSAQYMDALLRDMLNFSRISQQNMQLDPVDVGPVVRAVISRLQSEIDEKKASVDWAGPSSIVMADRPTLDQAILNLVGNALKFARPGVPLVVTLRAEEKADGFIRVWVEDNGLGIASDHHEQIFRLFTRLHGEKFPGTGVGLAIVQKGMERMGGRSGVVSTLGQGSRFWFELKKA